MRYQQEVLFARSPSLGYMRHNFRDLYPGFGVEDPSRRIVRHARISQADASTEKPVVTNLEIAAGVVGLLVSLFGATVVRELHEGLGNVVIGAGGSIMGAAVFMNISRRNNDEAPKETLEA